MGFKSQISNLILLLLAATLLAGVAFSGSQEDRQQSLIARLASGDDEQRFDTVAQLVVLFNASPNSALPQTLAALTGALQRDNSPLVRALAARALETCCGQQAVPALLASLAKEREIAVRKATLYALAAHRSPQIAPAIIPLLKDKQPDIRAVAAYALAEIGEASSAEALIEVLQKRRSDEDAFARSQAARGLGRIGNRSMIGLLLNSLAHDKSQEVRRESASALGLIANRQDAQVIQTLRNATLQPDPYLAAIAAKALEIIALRNP